MEKQGELFMRKNKHPRVSQEQATHIREVLEAYLDEHGMGWKELAVKLASSDTALRDIGRSTDFKRACPTIHFLRRIPLFLGMDENTFFTAPETEEEEPEEQRQESMEPITVSQLNALLDPWLARLFRLEKSLQSLHDIVMIAQPWKREQS